MAHQLAFLGLGVMGAPMTVNLVRHGFSVNAWNRTPNTIGVEIVKQSGANVVDSIQEAVATAEIIFTCVGDVADVEEVLLGDNGVIHFAQVGTLIVDLSTIGSQAAKKIASELEKYDLRFLDAPVSGGDIGAQKGTLTIMVGGEEQDFIECQPYFAAIGKTIRLCGAVGSGQAVKLCNQVLGAVHMVALCEAIYMAKIQGIDPSLMIEVCQTGAAGSWALSNLGPKIVASDLEPGFMIKHILKDLRFVQEIVAASEENLLGVELADRLFKIVAELDQGAQQGTQAMIRAYLKDE
ncbi:oxidoreductase [Aphanothece hegewaldii CCALA 016]|uniref:Oxidoreductase n=1 Tax=Aphanothece hegewaldii CCALA 016 TaxID=2107694 RepID=A0A2T1M1A2_9CHRO|nr:NAD(P)-dependent oxidoreductase [Aphanothece hegewaldii]PSF38473.1 oxidoreductase [Aphanothece hegewaldii CCALA 016]